MYLREAIDSVLAQTLRPHEIIVVDDASTDGSPALIRDYEREHMGLVRPIFHSHNAGVARTRIDAMEAVTGDFVTYVDGDDRMLPTKLERERDAITASGATLAFSNYVTMDDRGRRGDAWITTHPPPQGNVFVETFARSFPSRGLFRCELVQVALVREVGGYDSSLRIFEDFDLRIRLTGRCRAVYVDEPLSEYRLHSAGLSAAGAAEKFAVLQRIYRRHQALLRELTPARRRFARCGFQAWAAEFAHAAALSSIFDGEQARLPRRWRAARLLAFCAAHNPDLLTFGDLCRLVLPARVMEAWMEGLVNDGR